MGVSGTVLCVILGNFMKVLMTFERFLVTFEPFLHPFWAVFDPIWSYIGSFWDQKMDHLGHFEVILDHFLGRPGSFWGHYGIVVASFGHHFGIIFGQFRCVFEPFRWFWGIFRRKTGSFGAGVKKMYWNPTTLFWIGAIDLWRNQAIWTQIAKIWPVLGAKKSHFT